MENIKKAKAFIKRNPLAEISAARFGYSLLLMPGLEDRVRDIIITQGLLKEKDITDREMILNADVDQLKRILRTSVSSYNKSLFFERVLEHETEIMPEVKRRILTTQINHFIENALRFLVKCTENPSDWIISNLDDIRNPYARSTLCLALGFRADPSVIPFLIDRFNYFRAHYPDQTYEQAPLLALQEICERFPNG